MSRSTSPKRPSARALVLAAIGAAAVVAVAVLLFTTLRRPDPRIAFTGLTDEQIEFAAGAIRSMESELPAGDIELNGDASAPADIVLAPLGRGLTASRGELAAIPRENFELLPSSVREVGRVGGTEKLLPVALDHVEVLYRYGSFAERGALVDGRIRSLEELEAVARDLAEPGFFPIVVAGGEDAPLLDFVSVLTLSLGGVDAYRGLLEDVGQRGVAEDGALFEGDLAGGLRLSDVAERLRAWRQSGILHPQWTQLGGDDVFAFAEAQRTAAVVMRLSEHRSWPVYALRRWRSSPFPYENPRAAGTGLVAPVYVAAVPADAPWREEALTMVPRFVEEEFQSDVVQAWRLAPTNSTAEALDRESAEVRLWAAASRDILPSLADALPPETAAALAEAVRGRVGR